MNDDALEMGLDVDEEVVDWSKLLPTWKRFGWDSFVVGILFPDVDVILVFVTLLVDDKVTGMDETVVEGELTTFEISKIDLKIIEINKLINY